MNKLVKGAIATGVGVILLVGGGGTLATWNQTQSASMGSVVSGDLNLEVNTATDKGHWTNASGSTINVATYKVVPGDVLTYTQDLKVTLTGDQMRARLSLTVNGTNNGFNLNNVDVYPTTLMKGGKDVNGAVLLPADSGIVTASTKMAFKTSTGLRDSTKANGALDIGYKLVQDAPATANGL